MRLEQNILLLNRLKQRAHRKTPVYVTKDIFKEGVSINSCKLLLQSDLNICLSLEKYIRKVSLVDSKFSSGLLGTEVTGESSGVKLKPESAGEALGTLQGLLRNLKDSNNCNTLQSHSTFCSDVSKYFNTRHYFRTTASVR